MTGAVEILPPDHAQRAHSELGASSASRWINCPGSVLLARGMPNRSSVYAAAGTAAHELGELCLRSGQEAIEYIDRQVGGFTVDEDTVENVQTYLDTCRDLWGDWREIEARFSLESLAPPVPMFGTGDFVSYDSGARTLSIVDYKNGWLKVNPKANPQLKYYALGALIVLAAADMPPPARVNGIIVQRDVVKPAEFDPLELGEWSIDLMSYARATLQPGAPLAAGPWCKFCPASGNCAEQARSALAAAQAEFSGATITQLPDPRLLTPEQASEALLREDEVSAWFGAVRETASARIWRGIAVPAWKLVPTDPVEKWKDPAEAAELLPMLHDVEPYKAPGVISPAQARGKIAARLVADAATAGQKLTKKAAEAAAKAALKPLIQRVSSGVKLVPDSHPSPAIAITGGGTEFPALPAPETP